MTSNNENTCLSCTAKQRDGYCMGFCGARVDHSFSDTCAECFDEPCKKCKQYNNNKFGHLCDDCAIPELTKVTTTRDVTCISCNTVFTISD